MTQRRYDVDKKAARELTRALKQLPENQLMCRGLRHAWAVDEDFHLHPVKGSKTIHLRRVLGCMRGCGVSVVEIYIQTRINGLERTSRYTVYPEGYQIPGVPRGVKPLHIVQQEHYRRAMEKVARAARGETETAER